MTAAPVPLDTYDDFTVALHALRGLYCLVSGAGNVIEPGEFGPLFGLVVDQFNAVHDRMQQERT